MDQTDNGNLMISEESNNQDAAARALLAQFCLPPQQSASRNEEMCAGDAANGFLERAVADLNRNNHDLLKQKVADLDIQLTYVSHQVTLLLNALHVPSCQCDICKPRYQNQIEMFKLLKENATLPAAAAVLSPDKDLSDKPPTDTTQNGFIEKQLCINN
ncbi:unnamed protein product, partial [Gongylonema pulchrum]|uniref:Elf4 domain-containing protein n=1 Tax=Gongylonema pulchrum TaxID=637853 RepID=A0A183DSB9_9BILA